MAARTFTNRDIDTILMEISDSMRDYAEKKEMILSQLEFSKFSRYTGDALSRGCRFAAVDSSSASVVDAGCFIVMAHRAGAYTVHVGRDPTPEGVSQLPVNLSLINTSKNAVEKHFKQFLDSLSEVTEGTSFDDTTSSEDPPGLALRNQPRLRDVDWLQLIRTVSEWKQVVMLLDELESGDYILRDGPLRADIRMPAGLVEGILQTAAEKGIHIVGVVKRSTIPAGAGLLMPIVPAVQKLGTLEIPESCWYTPLPLDGVDSSRDIYHFGRTYIVQYNPLSQFVFQTDINKFDAVTPDEVFSKIAGLCNDPTYIGYPYPLALIHNEVVLTRTMIEDIKYDLQGEVLRSNTLSYQDWELLFNDFHEILDINTY
jgi:hypothetical protein